MVDGFSCILDFSKFSGGGPPDPPPPLIKGIHKLNPQNLSSTATAAEDKKQPEKPFPIKTICKKFIFRLYRNWKKEEGTGTRSFLYDL